MFRHWFGGKSSKHVANGQESSPVTEPVTVQDDQIVRLTEEVALLRAENERLQSLLPKLEVRFHQCGHELWYFSFPLIGGAWLANQGDEKKINVCPGCNKRIRFEETRTEKDMG